MCLAVPGKIIETGENRGVRTGRVEFGGIVRQACLDFVPEARIGDYVLVHVGFAISRIDPAEARRTLDLLRSMDLLDAELGPPPETP